MRLLKIGVYYPTYLEQFYARREGLAAEPSAAQHAALMHDCFGSSDFWTNALAGRGYETCDIVANAEPLQKRWAEERGVRYREDGWLFEITAAQIKAFRPDVIIVADYTTVTAPFIRLLRDENPSLRLVLGWCGAPYADPSVFRACDAVLSCVPELVEHFRAEGHRCHHLDHAFEPRVLGRLDPATEPAVDFSFIGSVVNQRRFHQGREKLLTELVERTGLRIWSEIERAAPRKRRTERARRLVGGGVRLAQRVGVPPAFMARGPLVWRAMDFASRPAPAPSVDARIARRARPPLFGLDMFRQLRASRVALNTHIDISTDNASNMRLFEATGVGACLLTDWKANLPRLFEPDAEVVTYRGTDECVEKVKYLLDHKSERRAVAAAGQRRTLRDHTFARRAERLDGIIKEELAGGTRG
jgi:hypothetical protein